VRKEKKYISKERRKRKKEDKSIDREERERENGKNR